MTMRDDSLPVTPVPSAPEGNEDDVIRLEDLSPSEDVHGGRKILLGEVPTPASSPRLHPDT
jgi:hypothetical protein